MKKTHFNNILILLPFWAMMLCSCKDDGLPLRAYPLTATDNQMIPYEVGDEIYFVQNGKSEYVRFTVTKDTLEWSDRQEEWIIIRQYERTVHMQSECGDYEFKFLLSRELDPCKNLNVYFYMPNSSVLACLLYNREGNFVNADWQYQHIYDSLCIGNHVYYDVVVNRMYERIIEESGDMTLYYNKTHGVLQVVEGGEPLLTRVP